MAGNERSAFLSELQHRYGAATRLAGSRSMLEVGDGRARIYVRYSKLHERGQTFFGLRQEDLRNLEGHNSFICFLWDEQQTPLLLPFQGFEEVFDEAQPASDGQFKVQVYLREDATILYVARTGRFNVDAYFGWTELDRVLEGSAIAPVLTHPQVQTLLAGIGNLRRFDIWVPINDRPGMDWSLTSRFTLMNQLPPGFDEVKAVLQEIDVVWVQRGSGGLAAAYEIEHSTPIYSGLLRLNDVRLVNPHIDRLTVVSDEIRRAAFMRQLNRPTFNASSLSSVCTFLDYREVYDWHRRLAMDRARDPAASSKE
jgi:hypothetical protein